MDFLADLFHKIYDVKGLVMWAGYIGLFAIIFAETGLLAGFFLPGDSLLVTAGLFAASGVLNVWYLNIILIVAAIVGNSVGYWIGKKSGQRLFKREKSLLFRKDYLIMTKEYYEKHGPNTLIVTRFMPLLRTFAPVVAGVGQMEYSKFTRYNIIGGVFWITSLTLVGYFLGTMVPNIEKHIDKVIIVVVILSFSPAIIKYLKHKFGKKHIAEKN